jgi:Fe-S cluster biogenesis protein NfuA
MGCQCCGGGGAENNGKKVKDIENFRTRVSEAIEEIRPALQMDGGDVQLVDVKDNGDVHVVLQGACGVCPHAQLTLKMGIEQALKEQIPEVNAVFAV